LLLVGSIRACNKFKHQQLLCPLLLLLPLLQARQLPLLAPVLPTKRPSLHSHCYDLVLQVTN
jgi:hypothetical protein